MIAAVQIVIGEFFGTQDVRGFEDDRSSGGVEWSELPS